MSLHLPSELLEPDPRPQGRSMARPRYLPPMTKLPTAVTTLPEKAVDTFNSRYHTLLTTDVPGPKNPLGFV